MKSLRAFFIALLLLCGCSNGEKKETRNDNGHKEERGEGLTGMIQVAGGTFQMGSTMNSRLQSIHSVTVGPFSIDKCEITNEKWTDVRTWGLTHGYTDLPVGRNGSSDTTSHPVNHPVTEVNWYDILKWCNARSEKDGLTPVYYTSNTLDTVYRTGQLDIVADAVKWTVNGYRLPTEAEWEFAARGGTKSQGYTFSGSNNIDSVAWCNANSGNNTHPVGIKGANELGIHDMSGNVWEWCWDWAGAYGTSAQTNPKGPNSGTHRVLRGGSFFYYALDGGCSVVVRLENVPSYCVSTLGFRCVLE